MFDEQSVHNENEQVPNALENQSPGNQARAGLQEKEVVWGTVRAAGGGVNLLKDQTTVTLCSLPTDTALLHTLLSHSAFIAFVNLNMALLSSFSTLLPFSCS